MPGRRGRSETVTCEKVIITYVESFKINNVHTLFEFSKSKKFEEIICSFVIYSEVTLYSSSETFHIPSHEYSNVLNYRWLII